MSTEIALLRALFLFSRRSTPPTLADLIAHVGAPGEHDVELAIASLVRAGLVQPSATPAAAPRLSLAGLAVAAAASAHAKANARRAKTVARPKKARTARIIPMRMRGRAA